MWRRKYSIGNELEPDVSCIFYACNNMSDEDIGTQIVTEKIHNDGTVELFSFGWRDGCI